jgi:hypothetical protein
MPHWILIAAFDDGLNGNAVPIIANRSPAAPAGRRYQRNV